MKLKLSPEQSANLNDIIRIFRQESAVRDNLQEEMLRIILKRFIITCTRIAREKCGVTPEQEKAAVFIFWLTSTSAKRSRCRIMPTCYFVPQRHSPICLPLAEYLLRCVLSMNG